MNIQTLKKLSTTRPRVVLDWAKRFFFLPEWEQKETYNEEALIAFQAISRAATHTPKEIVEWVTKKWGEAQNYRPRDPYTFGTNPSIEFDNTHDWIEALFKGMLTAKPHLFSNLIEAEITARGAWDQFYAGERPRLVLEYLKALSEKKPRRAFEVMVMVWEMRDPYHNYEKHKNIKYTVSCFLHHAYRQNPERVLRFVEQKAKHLRDADEFGEIADEVMGLK